MIFCSVFFFHIKMARQFEAEVKVLNDMLEFPPASKLKRFLFPQWEIYGRKKHTVYIFLNLENRRMVFSTPPTQVRWPTLYPPFPSEESRVNKVSEEVRIGQEVSVRVLSAEGKLTLSMKPISFLGGKKNTKKRRWKSHCWDRCRKWWETFLYFFRREFDWNPSTTSCFNAIHQ